MPTETDRAGGDQRRVLRNTGRVDGLTCRHIVRTVQHHVGKGHFALQIFPAQPRLECDQFDIGVKLVQPLARNVRFRLVDIFCRKENLPLQIAEMYLVVIGQHQRAHARAGQIQRGGGA